MTYSGLNTSRITHAMAEAAKDRHMDVWRNGCPWCRRHHMPWWRSTEPPSHHGPNGGIARPLSRPAPR